MTNLKNCLIGLGYEPQAAQDLLNRHYMSYKYGMFDRSITENVKIILDIEHPIIEEPGLFEVLHNFVNDLSCYRASSRDDEEDSFFSGPHLWECDPFTGCDMYGQSYSGNF